MDEQEYFRGLREDIEKHGWIVMKVPADTTGPGFAYSIGMVRTLAHPEILIIGLPIDLAHRIINDIGNDVRAGRRFVAGAVCDQFLDKFDVTFRTIPARLLGPYLGIGLRLNEHRPFPALQMIYPDRSGRWPWHEDASPGFRAQQPVLADEPIPPWAVDSDGD